MFCKVKTVVIFGISIIGILFSACQSPIKNSKKNDTAVVLNILLDNALFNRATISDKELNSFKTLNDTIIFKQNYILTRHLSTILPYKFLTTDQMCELMALHRIPNLKFVALDEFKKVGSDYNAALGIHCMWRGINYTEPNHIAHVICEKQQYCNKILHVNVIKKDSGFVGKKSLVTTY